MSRLLEKLKEYDSSMPIGELIKKIEEEKQNELVNEQNVFNEIREKYKDVYLKVINPDTLFGKTLEIYHIKEVTSRERTVDWVLNYRVKGSKLAFSKRNFYFRNYDGIDINGSFTEKEFEEMEIISHSDYLGYFRVYDQITNQLTNLIK